MNSRWSRCARAAVALVVVLAGRGVRATDVCIGDPGGDASFRRTDPGNDGPLPLDLKPPDLVSACAAAWPSAPLDVVQFTLVFQGVQNPPGSLGLGNMAFDPYAYGPAPVFGFLDIDVDGDADTGGELGAGAALRYLSNVGRFGEVPSGVLGSRAAFEGTECDNNFLSDPQVERSGADFSIVLCGCFDIDVLDPTVAPGTGTAILAAK